MIASNEDNQLYDISRLCQVLLAEREKKYKGGIYYYTQTELAYNSNRIEGSRLERRHTEDLFTTQAIIAEEGDIIKGDDVIEMMNHFRAFDYLLNTLKDDLSEEIIKKFHLILKTATSDADLDWFKVGEYKGVGNIVGGQATAAPQDVPRLMKELVEKYHRQASLQLEDVIDFHVQFEMIHPFQDGNGRVGRLIMFRECLKNHISPFIIDADHKSFYYRGLSLYKKERGYLLDTCLSSQDKYIAYCEKLVPGFLRSSPVQSR